MTNIIKKCLLSAFILCILPQGASAAVKILPYSAHNRTNINLWQTNVEVYNPSSTTSVSVTFSLRPYNGSAEVVFSQTLVKLQRYNLTSKIEQIMASNSNFSDNKFTLKIEYPDSANISATAFLKYAGINFVQLPFYTYQSSPPVMQAKEISYASNNAATGKSFAIDFYNHSAVETQVTIEAIKYNTTTSFKTFNKKINGKGHALFSSSELDNAFGYTDFKLIIRYSSPDVFVTPLYFVSSGGTLTGGLFTTKAVSLLKDLTPLGTGTSYASWGSPAAWQTASPYWAYCGSSSCNYLLVNSRKTMDLIFAMIYHLYPTGRPDRRGSIGDATLASLSLTCSNHPEGSHIGGLAMDMNYYTKGSTNHTQYLPYGTGTTLRTYIWSINGVPTSGWYSNATLLTNVFDWERNYALFLMIKKVFPSAAIKVDNRILNYMKTQIPSKYGSTAVTEFGKFVFGDDVAAWNHHIHAHVYLGSTVNTSLDISTLQGLINR